MATSSFISASVMTEFLDTKLMMWDKPPEWLEEEEVCGLMPISTEAWRTISMVLLIYGKGETWGE